MSNKNETQYWVVGATWGGHDKSPHFVKNSMWVMGWEKGDQAEKLTGMRIGDRIAIKRMRGQGQEGINILHVGIITGISNDSNIIICSVNWVATDLNRVVASKGNFGTVRRPYKLETQDKEWLQEIFCL